MSVNSGNSLWTGLLSEIRFGLRILIKNAVLTVPAVLALVIGIGANTAVFSVVNAVLLRSPDFKQPDRLVVLWRTAANNKRGSVSAPDYNDWKQNNQSMADMAAISLANFNLQSQSGVERTPGAMVSANFFVTLGVKPEFGRGFSETEDQAGNDRVVVLSHSLWKQDFGSDRGLVGKDIKINNEMRTVIGIMPPVFEFPDQEAPSRVWVPLVFTQAQLQSRGTNFLFIIARLRDGVQLAQARSTMSAVARNIAATYPSGSEGQGVLVVPLQSELVADSRPALLVLSFAVGLIFLIACANVASTLLAQAVSRESETAIRVALGASRSRLIRQWVVQGLLISTIGAALALCAAVAVTGLLTSLSNQYFTRATAVHIDGTVLVFTLVISTLSGMMFGLVPVFHSARTDVQESLQTQGRGNSKSASTGRFRKLLIVSELVVSTVLLVGAGVMLKSFWKLTGTDPGFVPKNVITVQVTLPSQGYPDVPAASRFYHELLGRTAGIGGVQSVGMVNLLPLSAWGLNGEVGVEGQDLSGQPAPVVEYRAVDSNYFRVLSIPMIAGRFFTEQDGTDAPPVALVNRAFADRFWPREDPVGKQIRFSSRTWVRVVGVVGNVRQVNLGEGSLPELYVPYTQAPWKAMTQSMTLVIRSAINSASMVPPIRQMVQGLDQGLALYNVQSMQEVVAKSLGPTRLYTLLISCFAAFALVLAGVGVYGVVSYQVEERTHEIGLRMALGAQRSSILWMVLGQVIGLGVIGLGLGLASAIALGHLAIGLVYGVTAADPMILASVCLLLIGLAIAATFIPALRAASVSPLVALRQS